MSFYIVLLKLSLKNTKNRFEIEFWIQIIDLAQFVQNTTAIYFHWNDNNFDYLLA